MEQVFGRRVPASLWWGTCQGLPVGVGVGYSSADWSSSQIRKVFRAALEGWGPMNLLTRWKTIIFLPGPQVLPALLFYPGFSHGSQVAL